LWIIVLSVVHTGSTITTTALAGIAPIISLTWGRRKDGGIEMIRFGQVISTVFRLRGRTLT